MIVCSKPFTVSKDKVDIIDPLAVDMEISCSYMHVLTADDVDTLERQTTTTVIGKDVYGFQVEASSTETVSFSQVTGLKHDLQFCLV